MIVISGTWGEENETVAASRKQFGWYSLRMYDILLLNEFISKQGITKEALFIDKSRDSHSFGKGLLLQIMLATRLILFITTL